MCFYGQTTDKETHQRNLKKKLLITPFGPTRIVCVNFSSIGSFVFQIFEKKGFSCFFTDKQIDKLTYLEKKVTQTPSVDCEFQFNRFISFRISKNGFFWVCFCGQPEKFGSVLSGILFPDDFYSLFFRGIILGSSTQ